MTDIVKYIKDKILESEPDADVRPGSAVHDLLIAPLSSILRPYAREHEQLLQLLSLTDPETIEDSELDYLASNFFIERLTGGKVTGTVRVYYDRPVTVDIPINTKFTTSSGKIFYSKYDYSINRLDMVTHVEGGLFYAGDVIVEAEMSGKEYEIAANAINAIEFISVIPLRVRNPLSFIGGSIRETNTELASRIKETFVNNAMMSPYGIKKTISSQVTDVRDIEVIGAGSPYMKRDIVAADYRDSMNFLGKWVELDTYPGIQSLAYHKAHVSYNPLISGVNLPAYTDFEREFTQGEYVTIFRSGDGLYAVYEDEKEFATETFNGQDFLISGLGNNVYNNPGWVLSDPDYGVGNHSPFEFAIKPDLESIILGINSPNIPANTPLDYGTLQMLQDLLNRMIDGYRDDLDVEFLQNLRELLLNAQNPEVIHNYNPVFHRYVELNNNITITGKMKTTSPSSNGTLSYITVNRTSNVGSSIAPHDGYGIAWMPGDGTTYNVFIVDNNILKDDIWIGQNMITHDYGVNNFVQAFKMEILSDIWYNFEIDITANYGINCWIKKHPDDGGTPINRSDTPPVQFGGTYAYRPLAASQGSHFGVSVADTKNQEWLYGNLGIKVLGDNYPLHMFKIYMDPSRFGTAGELCTVNYYGYGEGLTDGVPNTNSIKLYQYNFDDADWEEIAEHNSPASGDIQLYDLPISGIAPTFPYSSTYVNNDYSYLLAAADTVTEPDHKIYTDYVEIVRGDGEHSGNKVDIFVDAPSSVKSDTISKTVSNGLVLLNAGTTELLGPVQEITEVAVGGIALDLDQWSVQYVDPGLAFSLGATIRIIPAYPNNTDGVSLDIAYRYLSSGASLQSIVESSNFRSPSSSNLIKAMPPYTVVIEDFPYNGNVSPTTLKAVFKEHINTLKSKTLSKSDLISLATANGASNVEVSDIDIDIRYQDLNGKKYSFTMANQYTITTIGNFYTDTSDLAGVNQL